MTISSKHKRMLADLLDACKENLPSVDEEMVRKSFMLSAEAHKNHFRASGEPYFNHPFEVAMIIAREIPLDDYSVVSALLHDVVEDADISLDFIVKEFNQDVANIVDGVTKIGGVFMGQQITQAENYRKLLLSMVKDVRVILVKFADRLHNMRTLEFVHPQKQQRISKETLEIYAPFAHRFGLGKIKWEMEDLAFKYLDNETYDELAKKLKNKRKEREGYLAKFCKPITEKLEEHKLDFEIGSRAKHLYSIYRKMVKLQTEFENIYDLLAVRIILEDDDPNQCYYILGIINQLYRPIPDRFKDYISIPKKNNYQSIHNTVIDENGKMIEIQIRTRKMHEIGECGVAAHWKYKENMSSNDSELEDWVNWIRDIFENVTKDEATKEILDSFELNLYQDEIYIFTPGGDLKRLPKKSTPVDFAYEIHSKVGYNCIGAKVNGKIVPLDSVLHSGDQVEIITSKNQHPNKSWLRFVKTHKARSNIRKHLNKEEEKIVDAGKELWEKKLKKLKLSYSSDDAAKFARKAKHSNLKSFYTAIYHDKINLEDLLKPKVEAQEQDVDLKFEKFADDARSTAGGVVVDGDHKGIMYNYSKCCNPVPGDPIVGYITVGEGIKIHRKDCINLINMAKIASNKIVPVEWPGQRGSLFVAGIRIRGEDTPGLLNNISNSITTYRNTNIKAINMHSTDSVFHGTITVFVEDLDHLNRLMEKLKKHKAIFAVERFDGEHA